MRIKLSSHVPVYNGTYTHIHSNNDPIVSTAQVYDKTNEYIAGGGILARTEFNVYEENVW